MFERDEGPWYRTPKTGRVTDPIRHLRQLKWLRRWLGSPLRSRPGGSAAHAVASPQQRSPRRLGWIAVGAMVLALSGIGVGAIHAPVVEAANTALFLHGASPFTLDGTSPVGAQQTMSMAAANSTRTWATTSATSASQTILASTGFTFNYSTTGSGTSNVTLRLGYSPNASCGVISNVQTGPEFVTNGSGNVTPTLPAASTAGTLLVVTIAALPGSAYAAPAGWTEAAVTSQAGDGRVDIWYRPNNPGGIMSATFTSTNTTSVAQMSEWRGVATSAPLDRTGTTTSAVNVISSTVSTSAGTTTVGDLGITDFTNSAGNLTTVPGWTPLIQDNTRGYESDFRLGLPAAVASETMTSTQASLWADAIATFLPAVTIIAQTAVTLTSGTGLSTASFTPAADVTVPAGSFLCYTVFVNSVTGAGLVLDYDAAATPTNLNSSQTIFIPELVLPFLGLAALAPSTARLRRRMRRPD